MATWHDLDSESGSDKDDAANEANFEDENEIYSKIPREELIDSFKELLTHFEHLINELNDLKDKYVDLMKQQ